MPYKTLFKTGICAVIICLLASCAGLKSAQLTAVEKYTVVTKGVSAIPPDMYSRVYQLRSQTQTLQLSGVIATNEMAQESINALSSDLQDKLKFLDMVDSFAYAYRIVGNYADLVHCLISESYLKNFTKNKNEWQHNFDGLVTTYNAACVNRIPQSTQIPSSVGSIAANIINEMGAAKIKYLQKKYLRNAISTARSPFEGICDDFLNTDIPKIQKELTSLPVFIDENFKDFLNNERAYENKQGNNPYNYYKYYLPIYLNWQVQLRELNELISKLQVCIRSLRESYGILDDYVNEANPSRQIPPAIVQLETNYDGLVNTIAKFGDARERLFKITY
ncbi:MAG: hypothetical protein JST86_13905 [Bacteroidetes bacterium]|nr:hypothetical protein [Bacteroidota bacterium]